MKGKGVRPLNISKVPLPTLLTIDQCKYVAWKLTQLGRKHPTGRINTQQRIMGTLCKQLWSALWTLAPVHDSNQCWSMGSSPYSSIHTMIVSWNQRWHLVLPNGVPFFLNRGRQWLPQITDTALYNLSSLPSALAFLQYTRTIHRIHS